MNIFFFFNFFFFGFLFFFGFFFIFFHFFPIFFFLHSIMDFQTFLASAASAARTPSPPLSKQLAAMPLNYVRLSLSSLDSGQVPPERIQGAIAPISVPGRLVQVHLPGADIRYMSGLFGEDDSARYMHFLELNRPRWDRFGNGRFVVQWSDPPGMKYVFSDVEYTAEEFPRFVDEIRKKVISVLRPIYGFERTDFNYCVCNCYANGSAGVNWHTDAEPHLVAGCPIACVSFGAERVFSLAKIPKSVTAEITPEVNVRLQSGSVIVMAGDTQKNFFHAIAKDPGVKRARFSLTFRVMRAMRHASE